MNRNLSRVFSYAMDAAVDADRMQSDPLRLRSAVRLSPEELETGQLLPSSMEKMGTVRGTPSILQKSHLRAVVVSPFSFRRDASASMNPADLVVPLWVPAILDIDTGILVPDYRGTPWISMDLLAPKAPPMDAIASIDSIHEYMTHHIPPREDQDETLRDLQSQHLRWQKWVQWGVSMLEWAASMGDSGEDGTTESNNVGAWIFPSPTPTRALAYSLPLMESMSQNPPASKIAQWMWGSDHPDPDAKDRWDTWGALRLHVSHMPTLPALTTSQRWMLRRYLVQQPPVYPVNGPSRSGKTSMLAHMVMQSWTQAALRKQELPPVCILTAKRSEDTLELLKVFQKVPEDARWLPVESGMGWGLVESSKNQLSVEFPNAWTDGYHGILHQLDHSEFLKQCQDIFLEKAEEAFGLKDLERIQDKIHERMIDLANPLGLSARMQKEEKDLRFQQEKLLKSFTGIEGGFDQLYKRVRTTMESRTQIVKRLELLLSLWNEHVADLPVWEKVLNMLPINRISNAERNRRFFQQYGTAPRNINLGSNASITQELERMVREMKRLLIETRKQWDKIKNLTDKGERLTKSKNLLENDSQWAIPVQNAQGFPEEQWEILRDLKERGELWRWTVRYWECVWLQQKIKEQTLPTPEDPSSRILLQQQLRQWSCLAPGLIVPMESIARFLMPWKTGIPMLEMADTLLVDNAHLVPSVELAPLVPLFKKMIVAGDPTQQDPVPPFPLDHDISLMMKHRLLHHPEDFANLARVHIPVSACNMQARADLMTIHPLWLTDRHFQHPSLVECAGHLAYDVALKSRAYKPGQLPPFAFMHIPGKTVFHGDSSFNVMELESLAAWVRTFNLEWREWYDMLPLAEVVCIVASSNRQAKMLQERLLDLKVNVFTPATLPSRQWPICLFSVTETLLEEHEPRFNLSNNLFNIVLSKARDSLWVVGNLTGWTIPGNKPSSRMAQHLFARPEVWLRNAILFQDREPLHLDGTHDPLVTRLPSTGELHIATPWIDDNLWSAMGWKDFLLQRKEKGNVHVHLNTHLFSLWNPEDILEIQDFFLTEGIHLHWHQGLFDTWIWSENGMWQANLPLLAMDNDCSVWYSSENLPSLDNMLKGVDSVS